MPNNIYTIMNLYKTICYTCLELKRARPMRESPNALQAYEDYLGLGADRSLSKLVAAYHQETEPPTQSLGVLKKWSTNFDWPQRIDLQLERERKEAEARFLENDKPNSTRA